MDIEELINNKTIKPKVKTETLSGLLLNKKISLNELMAFTSEAKDPAKATCIEAIEFVTKQVPKIANKQCFEFVTENLKSKAPRVKWESAKVVGNTAALFINDLDDAIKNLLENAKHDGTVVRWSAAFALGEILKLKTKHNKMLLSAIEKIVDKEEKNSIKKIYLAAIKKTK